MTETLLRSLPRCFIKGASAAGPVELPDEIYKKFTKVLRLKSGDSIAILPDDGTLIRCNLTGRQAIPEGVFMPQTEAKKITIVQALPKGDKLDEIVKACTQLGASQFVFFNADRSVVVWDESKFSAKLRRLEAIAAEASEVSFRTRIPTFEILQNLAGVFEKYPNATVLSESQSEEKTLSNQKEINEIVVGPEGGWSNRELELIGGRGVTLGPRVLRTEYAAAAALAKILIP